MKRDWLLIKEMLINAKNDVVFDDLFKDNLIVGHYHLLQDAGYVQGYMTDNNLRKIKPTWKGYDLLELLDENAIFELQDSGYPVTEYMLSKYAEFELEKELFTIEE